MIASLCAGFGIGLGLTLTFIEPFPIGLLVTAISAPVLRKK